MEDLNKYNMINSHKLFAHAHQVAHFKTRNYFPKKFKTFIAISIDIESVIRQILSKFLVSKKHEVLIETSSDGMLILFFQNRDQLWIALIVRSITGDRAEG